MVKCQTSRVNIWLCSKIVYVLSKGVFRIATTIRLVGQFNSVKMGIRLFNKRAKPKEVVKVEEHSS